MRARLMTLLFFVGILAAAYVLRLAIAPDVLPLGDAENPGWRFQLAFLLKATENIGLLGTAIIVLLGAFGLLRRCIAGMAVR